MKLHGLRVKMVLDVDPALLGGGCLAIVTGANKGIGFNCVQTLCEHLGNASVVVLTARNEELGKHAVLELERQGHKPIFHQLDITSAQSVDAFAAWVKEQGGCDILINNAGIAFKLSAPEPFPEQARRTVDTNYRSTRDMVEKFLPLMKSGGRVIQISSKSGQISGRSGAARFLRSDLTKTELDQGLEDFVNAAAAGKVDECGLWHSAYGVSKMGVTQYTRIAARDSLAAGQDLLIASCCPGLCRTDMTGGNKNKSVVSWLFWVATWVVGKSAYDGADTPVYLALLPKKDFEAYHGRFVVGRRVEPY